MILLGKQNVLLCSFWLVLVGCLRICELKQINFAFLRHLKHKISSEEKRKARQHTLCFLVCSCFGKWFNLCDIHEHT